MPDQPFSLAVRRGSACLAVLSLSLLAGVLIGMNCQGNMNGVDTAIFPSDYRQTYQLVRDCRNSIEHASTIRVWVNSIGSQDYLNDENPLPVGTIVVKEEYAGGSCDNDADLVAWSVMRKEPPGFDAANNDWDFREYAPDRTQTATPSVTCIECHNEPECVARDYMCTAP
jgi:hypothetical protein